MLRSERGLSKLPLAQHLDTVTSERYPGANTQGVTLDEARANLSEAVELVLDANRTLAEEAIAGEDVIREPLVIPAG